MDFSAFSHGQINSKLWLCEELEKILAEPEIPIPLRVAIIGSWYNILGFLLLVRSKEVYTQIVGIEIDQNFIDIANKIGDAFYLNYGQLENWNMSAHDVPYDDFDLIINTSIENIRGNDWYNKIPKGKLVCFQTCDISPDIAKDFQNWVIENPINSMEDFKTKFPLSIIYYQGDKFFNYGSLKYNRYMIIGKK